VFTPDEDGDGILDWVEFAVIDALVQDPSVDFMRTAASR
jgi:hypothetical protein